ncbi:MAG: biopolymer transporter ExbD [Lentisphaeria bacterium]|nr:biopolymer transporter ExbD [Lentisphaeria bacterium]
MRRRFETKCYDEINITPLMDTVFFLLIIFMITAPLLEYSFDVTPPAMKGGQIKADEFSRSINVNKNGQIEFEKKVIPMETLLNRLRDLKRGKHGSKIKLFLRADQELKYGKVIEILRTIRQAGHTDIALVTGDTR